MTDNERVVKELRNLRRYFEDKEWSPNRADRRSAKVYWQTVTDAIAMLKEQEAAYQGAEELLRQKTILFDDAIKRLKAQEAIRCKNCRNNHQCAIQFKFADADDEENWFCAYFNQIK